MHEKSRNIVKFALKECADGGKESDTWRNETITGTNKYFQSKNKRRFFKTINTPKGILVDNEETCIPKQNNYPGCGDVYRQTCNWGLDHMWYVLRVVAQSLYEYEGNGNYICDHC